MSKRLVVLLSLVSAASALAQVEPRASGPSKSGAPNRQVVDFADPDLVEGTLASPDLGTVYSAPRPGFGSLIHVRENFNDKLSTSVNM